MLSITLHGPCLPGALHFSCTLIIICPSRLPLPGKSEPKSTTWPSPCCKLWVKCSIRWVSYFGLVFRHFTSFSFGSKYFGLLGFHEKIASSTEHHRGHIHYTYYTRYSLLTQTHVVVNTHNPKTLRPVAVELCFRWGVALEKLFVDICRSTDASKRFAPLRSGIFKAYCRRVITSRHSRALSSRGLIS